jgi:hypothetical protein
MRKPTNRKKPAKTGPKPDTLKIKGNWRDAVKKFLSKEKPATGWPKDATR